MRCLNFSNTGPISHWLGGATLQYFRKGAGFERLPYLIAGRVYWKGRQTLLDYLQCDGRKTVSDPIVEKWFIWAEYVKYLYRRSVYKADGSSLCSLNVVPWWLNDTLLCDAVVLVTM